MKSKMIRKGLYITDNEQLLITKIMKKYGCVNQSQAIRLSINIVGNDLKMTPLPEISKYSRKY